MYASPTYSQLNNSKGPITASPTSGIQPVIPGLIPGTETFRFAPGLITQSDAGVFGFSSADQWLSFGKLNLSSSTVYGYRAQRAGRGLIMGYKGTLQTSSPTLGDAVIEWVGNSPIGAGNLTFKTSSSPFSGISNQVLRLREDGTSVFGFASVFDGNPNIQLVNPNIPQVEINSNAGVGVGLMVNGNAFIASISQIKTPSMGIAGMFTQSIGNLRYGIISKSVFNNVLTTGSTQNKNIGISSTAGNASGLNIAVEAVASSSIGTNFGILTSAVSDERYDDSAISPRYGIYSTAVGANSYAGFFNGNVLITSGTSPSDERLKKDIKTEENLLAKIKQLTPVTYYFKQENEKTGLNLPTQLQHGFVAQDLEAVFPELIRQVANPIFDKDNNKIGEFTFKSVNYSELISVLVGAVKELSEELEDMKENEVAYKKVAGIVDSKAFSLEQNVPNPFQSQTSISYSLPEGNRSSVIFLTDLSGQLIREYKLSQIKGSIIVDGSNLKKGVYIYTLISDNKEIISKKLILN